MTKCSVQMFSVLLCFAVLSQGQTDSAALREHLPFGPPNGAATDASVPGKMVMIKPQYILSYNRFTGTPDWAAWHTDSTWFGEVKRSNDFRADSTLPQPWYRVHEASYRRSGFDRGHLCPSGDRTKSREDNSATFLMTNMFPQSPNNNRGPWAALETYLRDLIRSGKEVYNYCGGFGSLGFLDSGRVQIPAWTWKVILILDAGEEDIHRVTSSTRTIAVVMSNNNTEIDKNEDWKTFRVTVDSVESMTGYDFFSLLPPSLQEVLESRTDTK